MHIHPLMRKPSRLQVSPLVTNSFLSFAISMVSKDSQISLQKKCQLFSKLIEQGSALVYIDDIVLLSHSKEHMFHLIEQLHIISTKHNLKLAPDKSFFMLLKVKFLGDEIGYITIKPMHSKVAAIHKIPSPTGWKSCSNEFHWCTQFLHQIYR